MDNVKLKVKLADIEAMCNDCLDYLYKDGNNQNYINSGIEVIISLGKELEEIYKENN